VGVVMQAGRILRTTGLVILTLGAAVALGTLVVRDQFTRHRRGLFSSRALQRFAALGYIAGMGASVELVQLLRDFVAWESRTLLRNRARQILERMEHQLGRAPGAATECAG
jgi:hypothetical protein